MKTFSPLYLLGALGALSAGASSAVAAVDTSQWKCETCPFEKAGTSGTLDAGAGVVSGDSAKFGDATGLDKKGAFIVAGGSARFLKEGGLFGSVTASDLGLDSRSIAGQLGQEGLYALRFGYAEIPHRVSDSAMTPFLGNGSAVLSLPTGFAGTTTAAMPLATTLHGVDLGFKRTRLDLGASVLGGENWTYRVSMRHDVRDGTQRSAGSFFTSSSNLVAPLDQLTDQLEVSASYNSHAWQATLAYYASVFSNDKQALTWQDPFIADPLQLRNGQLALAPDNQFHQIMASAGYAFSPTLRASAEVALGRMTQDAAYLEPTLNTALGVSNPVTSLNGRANTRNASLRLSAAPSERVRLNASITRDERDNQTPSNAYTSVTTDVFVGLPRNNQPYSFTQDRLKLSADYRGPGSWKTSAGAEHDSRKRTLQEAETTREATLWGRVGARPLENLSLALKLAHAQRNASEYLNVASITPPENPLLRKFNMADRTRDTAGLRADFTASETVNVGLGVDVANDDYTHSTVGLIDGRSVNVGGDVSVAVSDETQVNVFAQIERIRSRQVGSQLFAQPDWTGRSKDAVELVGVGLKHTALKGKLEIGADLAVSRSRSELGVEAAASSPAFPKASTSLESFKLRATYRLKDNMSLIGSYWYEHGDAQDWRFDGVLPATISNLLAFGETPPRYTVNVVQIALRYRF